MLFRRFLASAETVTHGEGMAKGRHVNVILDAELAAVVDQRVSETGQKLSAVIRAALRRDLGVSAGFDAGYLEGYAAGYEAVMQTVKQAMAKVAPGKNSGSEETR